MESKTLGKLNKKFMYLNHGKYGPFLTYEKVNYKIPEWFPHEKMDVDIAERLIEYKKKISEQWLEKTATPSQSKVEDDIASENDTDSEDEKEKVRKLLTFKKKM
jgi:topoisomerase IA-like protein